MSDLKVGDWVKISEPHIRAGHTGQITTLATGPGAAYVYKRGYFGTWVLLSMLTQTEAPPPNEDEYDKVGEDGRPELEDKIRASITEAPTEDDAWVIARHWANKGWWAVALDALLDSYQGG